MSKITVGMPEDMVAALEVASFQRRSLGREPSGVGALVREAVAHWLELEIAATDAQGVHASRPPWEQRLAVAGPHRARPIH